MSAPDTPRVRIVNDDGRGFMTKVFINDQDVSECFRSVKVSASTTGAVVAELEAIVGTHVDIAGLEHLRFVSGETRELLVRHGWTPPAEPAPVPAEVRSVVAPSKFQPLVPGLFGDEEPVDARAIVDRFTARLGDDWEPTEHDRFTVERVFDEDDQVVPDKTRYTLTVVLDSKATAPSPPEDTSA